MPFDPEDSPLEVSTEQTPLGCIGILLATAIALGLLLGLTLPIL